MGNMHLVIGDPHAKVGISNDRFDWLGQLIMDRRPDVIVCLGDFYDMPSLSSYDRGKGTMEGRRYSEDLRAGEDALRRIIAPMDKYNRRMANNKKKQYRPRMIMVAGNHDYDRLSRAVNQDPWTLDGVISHSDFKFQNYGWETYGYLDRVCVDGVTYTHCVQHKNSSQIVGGMHHAHQLLNKLHCSVTVGHSHILDVKTDTDGNGKRINGLVAGCYFEHFEEYANQSNMGWWRGLCICHDVSDGDYDLETISIKNVRKMYGT